MVNVGKKFSQVSCNNALSLLRNTKEWYVCEYQGSIASASLITINNDVVIKRYSPYSEALYNLLKDVNLQTVKQKISFPSHVLKVSML